MKKDTLIVNLYGGPGTSKSSMMGGIFSSLKFKGVDAELVPEFAKDVTWETQIDGQRILNPDGTPFIGCLRNQIHIFGEQHHRLFRLIGNVDVIITDSPILLQLCYNTNPLLNALIVDEHKKFNTLDIFLERKKPYNPNGRSQNLQKAKELDEKCKSILLEHSPTTYYYFDGLEDNIPPIVESIIDRIKINKLQTNG